MDHSINAWRSMERAELEKVLGRVAELVDTKKAKLVQMFPSGELPSAFVKPLSKGELIAELIYFDCTGVARGKLSWY
jgi:hypothetical protein